MTFYFRRGGQAPAAPFFKFQIRHVAPSQFVTPATVYVREAYCRWCRHVCWAERLRQAAVWHSQDVLERRRCTSTWPIAGCRRHAEDDVRRVSRAAAEAAAHHHVPPPTPA